MLSTNVISSEERKITQKIMVLSISALGDFLLAVPLIIELRTIYPGCRITVVCIRPEVAVFARDTQIADEVVTVPAKARRSPLLAFRGLKLIKEIQADIAFQAISSHGTFGNILMGASGASIRCGFKNGRLTKNLTHLVPIKTGRHRITLNMDLLRRLGHYRVVDPTSRYLPYLEHSSIDFPSGTASNTFGKNYLLFSIGSDPKLAFKRWSNDKWAALVSRIKLEYGITSVFVGSRGESEGIDGLIEKSGVAAVNLAGKTSLADLASLVSESLAVVGTDGMLLHLAAAIDKPVVGLFGPTDAAEVGPFGKGRQIVTLSLPCSPCYNNLTVGQGISCTTYECLTHLDVELVYSRITPLLQQTRNTQQQGTLAATISSDS